MCANELKPCGAMRLRDELSQIRLQVILRSKKVETPRAAANLIMKEIRRISKIGQEHQVRVTELCVHLGNFSRDEKLETESVLKKWGYTVIDTIKQKVVCKEMEHMIIVNW